MPTKRDLLAKLELAELRALAKRYGVQVEAPSRHTDGVGFSDATAADGRQMQTRSNRTSLVAVLTNEDQVVLHEAFSKHYSPARLRDLCEAFGLETSGKKLDFIARLTGHHGRPREFIKQALKTLPVKRLGNLCDAIGIDRTSVVKRDELVDLVVRAKRFSFEKVLEQFSLSELKRVCRAQDLNDSGDKKDELVARILGRDPLLAASDAPAPVGQRKRVTAQMTSTKPMEQMLWDAACSIRGEKDAAKFKDYLLPLLFLKRLSDVFDDEIERLAQDYGNRAAALEIAEGDHSLLRFYLPAEARWAVISGRQAFEWPPKERPRDVGEHLTKALRAVVKHNPSLSGVIDVVDFAAERNGERDMNPAKLRDVVETFSDPRYRLGLADVQPDFLGRAYEYLLRKFAEGSGQSAGEFFTPTEVGYLMAWILRPRPGQECHDYACGSLGLVIKLQLVARELDPTSKVPLKLSGQELQTESYAIAKMNAIIHDMDADIQRGDTIINPKFRAKDGRLRQHDIVVANPMWNQPLSPATLVNDPFDRFRGAGGITAGRGDWAWLQHTLACLNDHGRAAVVLDTGAVTRGSGSRNEDKERTIRKWFVDRDLIEGVILLPENLFYNTNAAGIIVVLSKKKPASRKERIILLNASRRVKKGRPKNFIPQENIRPVAEMFNKGEPVEGELAVITLQEAQDADYNLSPSRWIDQGEGSNYGSIGDLVNRVDHLTREGVRLWSDLEPMLSELIKEVSDA